MRTGRGDTSGGGGRVARAPSPGELVRVAQRAREGVVLPALTGVGPGVGVGLFGRLVVDALLEPVLELSPWILAFVPLCGLVVAAASLRWLGRDASPASADLYLESFHDPRNDLRLREVPARMIAAIATLGSGGPMG